MKRYLVAIAFFTFTSPVFAEEQCLKMVFNEYCLGGKLNVEPLKSGQRKGYTMALFKADGEQSESARVYKGKIMDVMRSYKRPTLLKFYNLEASLEEVYGKAETEEFFPSYANDMSSKQSAIHLEKAYISNTWKDNGVTIKLVYMGRNSFNLFYSVDKIKSEYESANPNPSGL